MISAGAPLPPESLEALTPPYGVGRLSHEWWNSASRMRRVRSRFGGTDWSRTFVRGKDKRCADAAARGAGCEERRAERGGGLPKK